MKPNEDPRLSARLAVLPPSAGKSGAIAYARPKDFIFSFGFGDV